MLKTTNLLGISITNSSTEDILEYVYKHVKTAKTKLFIVTPNPEIIVHAHKHPDYKRLLNQANLSLPDGVGVFIAGGLLGHQFKERIPGVDFMEELCRSAEGKTVSIGLLGGKRGVAKRTAECLKRKYPWIRIAFVSSEWPADLFMHDEIVSSKYKVVSIMSEKEKIPTTQYIIHNTDVIDILFVAFGFPKQEEWIFKHLEMLPVKAAMGVGGAFDYLSGNIHRAPYIIRAMGLEWLYRLMRQPWRIKRQLALVEFIYLILKERFTKK